MDSREKLRLARNIIIKEYSDFIREIDLNKDRPVLKVIFFTEIILYVRYNDYDEYTYCIIYSPNPDNQMRFDNYDDVWNVKTRPNHIHIRGMQSVIESPMRGIPDVDIPILIKYIYE
jgi:hypothetical protein